MGRSRRRSGDVLRDGLVGPVGYRGHGRCLGEGCCLAFLLGVGRDGFSQASCSRVRTVRAVV
jgi:hypothetical protein